MVALSTPPIDCTGGAEHVRCLVSNVGAAPVTVDVRLKGGDRIAYGDSGTCTLSPGQSECSLEEDCDGFPFPPRCDIEILSGRRQYVCGSISAKRTTPSGVSWLTTLPAE